MIRAAARARLRAPFFALAFLGACVDAGDFSGEWVGDAVGEGETSEGFPTADAAHLTVEEADLASFRAQLTTREGLFDAAEIEPIPGAEADVLADMTFSDSPLRVYLAFAETEDRHGPALVVVALYGEPTIEVRILRGGEEPLYEIFALERP